MLALAGKVVLAGGGTGGHVTPALALADAFKALDPACEVLFVGSAYGMEATLVPARGWRLETVPGARLVGAGISGKINGLRQLVAGVRAAVRLLRREKPVLVVGVGGYASGAALLAARLLRIPTAIHESNALPGLTNRVVGQFVDRVYLGFAAALPSFDKATVQVSGNPVRPAILRVGPKRQWRGERALRVLVMGGSQGSEFLNANVPPLLGRLRDSVGAIEVRHQVGKLVAAPVQAAYESAGIPVAVSAFIDDMAATYAWADLAVARAGSGTVSELSAAGLPALLVPFPHAAGDHQAWNAKAFADAGAGLWCRQQHWDEAQACEALLPFAADRARWTAASRAALSLLPGDAATVVAADCLRWLEEAR
jgi:UDP-N-acetylglucosamine--N-acetylmuramyl-(pentapeptide) pyrophosphoryl-undecaprenol N-acetylglucosamine transferase